VSETIKFYVKQDDPIAKLGLGFRCRHHLRLLGINSIAELDGLRKADVLKNFRRLTRNDLRDIEDVLARVIFTDADNTTWMPITSASSSDLGLIYVRARDRIEILELSVRGRLKSIKKWEGQLNVARECGSWRHRS